MTKNCKNCGRKMKEESYVVNSYSPLEHDGHKQEELVDLFCKICDN